MKKRIFALDIGTRSVTGIILQKQEHTYTVCDFHVEEHRERSMLDGQIHNVRAVADVITNVKSALEKKYGTLTNVCVAAAGRSLITKRAKATIQLDQQPITKEQTVKHLELSAVQSAQFNLAQENEQNAYKDYYCVGYSVLHYALDGEMIGSLIDQSGRQASVEVIATFLPKVVIDSLLSALNHAQLSVEALTLEPIAAIHILIPESMRRLNVALVDIGAGTSDIALTKYGTVVAYGMVPMAGDKITEVLSDAYLLDFPVAEQTKRNIALNGKDTVQDILGFEHSITYEQLVQDTTPVIDELASALTEEILTLNERPPQAVMLIGGGSQTPNIAEFLAKKLQLPNNRVAVRDVQAIQNLNTEQIPSGPDFVTPIGIAMSAHQNPIHYVTVTVNKKKVRMFELKQLTVGDCLIQAGIDVNKMYGKPGLAIFITVNGKQMTISGQLGQPPHIYLNGERTNVDAPIKNGDIIDIQKGLDGNQPNVTLRQLIGDIPKVTVYFQDKPYQLHPTYYVNGQEKAREYIIKDKDSITWKQTQTVGEFLSNIQVPEGELNFSFSIYVNGEKVNIEKGETEIYINDKPAEASTQLQNNDHIKIKRAKTPRIKDLLYLRGEKFWHSIDITFNDEPVTLKQQQLIITRDSETLTEESLLHNDDHIMIEAKPLKTFIFQDVFRFIDIDLSNVSGTYQIYKNNERTSFDEVINHGDSLRLEWTN